MSEQKVGQRRDTPESRSYWEGLEATARECDAMVKRDPWLRTYVKHFLCGQMCRYGDGIQTCRAVEEVAPADPSSPETP